MTNTEYAIPIQVPIQFRRLSHGDLILEPSHEVVATSFFFTLSHVFATACIPSSVSCFHTTPRDSTTSIVGVRSGSGMIGEQLAANSYSAKHGTTAQQLSSTSYDPL